MKQKWNSKIVLYLCVVFTMVITLYYFLTHFAFTNVIQKSDNEFQVNIKFIFPMERTPITDENLKLKFEISESTSDVTEKWISRSKLQINIKQIDLPFGQKITYKLTNLPTKIDFLKMNLEKSFTPRIAPTAPVISPEHKVSTVAPVLIKFNTFITPESMKKVRASTKGKFIPKSLTLPNGEDIVNTSEWFFIPEKRLKNDTIYTFTFPKDIQSRSGLFLNEESKRSFKTGIKPKPASIDPKEKAKGVSLFPEIKIKFNEEMKKGKIKILNEKEKEIKGITKTDGNVLLFKLDEVLMPNSQYKVEFLGINQYDEPSKWYTYTFQTMDLGNKMWVDIHLGKIHTMTVYKGKKVLRKMLCSGGRPDYETPLGTYYTKDKGPSFFSARFGEGAKYWVRLFDQYLIHSIPRDDNWKLKEDEHNKLGTPASHGCIRLDDENAKWFYQKVSPGTMVIIRE